MCLRALEIKSKHKGAPIYSFVPCGKCEECRDSKRIQWTFRNRCELENARRKGWHIGFFTLTYSDEYLPLIPRHMFRDNYEPVCCFRRSDVRNFIDNIRKRSNERWKVSNLRYLIACEYGEHTQRSHMHGIICFPPQITPQQMWDLIHDSWTTEKVVAVSRPDKRYRRSPNPRMVVKNRVVRVPLGHIFPRYITGGVDSHGYEHKPFLVTGDVAKASYYAAKYCCKDIGYANKLSSLHLVDEPEIPFSRISDYAPFHIQSQSFGKCYLDNLPTSRLLDLIQHGEDFVGSAHKQFLPTYIKNKVFYNLYYTFDDNDVYNDDGTKKSKDWWYDFECDKWCYKKGQGTHRRFVGREASQFLKDNAELIFRQKKAYFSDLFSRMQERSFWVSRGLKGLELNACLSEVNNLSSVVDISEYYLSYYGVPESERDYSRPAHLSWLQRYIRSPHGVFDSTANVNDACITSVCKWLKYCTTFDKSHRVHVRCVSDLYKHLA